MLSRQTADVLPLDDIASYFSRLMEHSPIDGAYVQLLAIGGTRTVVRGERQGPISIMWIGSCSYDPFASDR